ncbi:uncharacterized protein F4822DRAFT_108933 [Hypoxylon trugodes]|uniref:uncharacterized protein n=1 Tax=Hypoxylon trugodes TaxID=326681 RepID=UPI00218E875D|nr:uncharacterized protein F4822DRAFT_108933 [Hypoxylon trugodes]KAI1391897.1 hypothetical protein F4822DRAFT_108933 [Hypoxylon trugodes]
MLGPNPPYYLAGWDRERMLNGAASGEINDLTEEQKDVFRKGLRADLGEQGFDEFFDEMFKRELVASGKTPVEIVREPPFMQAMRLCAERDMRWDQWGFVIFKSPEIIDASRWEACKQRFLQIVDGSIGFYRGYDGLDECIQKMKFQWVEDVGEANGSPESIARKYSSSSSPPGLDHSVCLYITPSSMDSILDSPDPSSSKRRYRKEIPFVIAVSRGAGEPHLTMDEDEAGYGWRGYFNVAVETLFDSLFPIVAHDSRAPFEIGGRVSGEDIWCDHTRWGVHKAGIGYCDRRQLR